MGNETSVENWAARERLLLVERAAWWRGWIGRGDLVAMFGISPAQASSDLQKYQELNPGGGGGEGGGWGGVGGGRGGRG